MKPHPLFLTVLTLLVVAAGSFYAGTRYQQTKSPNMAAIRAQFGDRNGGGLRPGGNRPMAGRQIMGEIGSLDANTLTIKLVDGSSKIILLSDKTTIVKTSESTLSELKVGSKIGVFGSENTDGSVSAQNIQVNPLFRDPSSTPSPKN